MQNAQQRLEKIIGAAMIQLVENRPLYFSLLKRIPKVFREDLNEKCALGVDESTGLLSILLNPDKLSEACVDDLRIILEHLLIHTLLPHHHQERVNSGLDFHLACDMLINQAIDPIREQPNRFSNGKSIFGKLLTPNCLSGLHGFGSAEIEHASVFEIWPIISDNRHVQNLGQYGTIDETAFYIQNFMPIGIWCEKSASNERILRDQVKANVTAAVRELSRAGKSPGNLPMFLSKRITEILAESGVDYSSLLKKFASDSIERSPKRTWARPNRKYPGDVRGRSRANADSPVILIVIDTSGSMWSEPLLEKIQREIVNLVSICPNVWIVGGDVQETLRVRAQSGFDPKTLVFKGGGGTDLQFGFDAAVELGVNGVIVMTDGHIPDPNSHGVDAAFVIVPGGIAVQGYENIFIT